MSNNVQKKVAERDIYALGDPMCGLRDGEDAPISTIEGLLAELSAAINDTLTEMLATKKAFLPVLAPAVMMKNPEHRELILGASPVSVALMDAVDKIDEVKRHIIELRLRAEV